MPDPGDDALQRLRDQVRAASETAARVAEEAAKAAADTSRETSGAGVPKAGYAVPGSVGAGAQNAEIQALTGLLELIRELIPADLQEQIVELVRELLALLRALVDLVISRMERERPAEAAIEDIPIG